MSKCLKCGVDYSELFDEQRIKINGLESRLAECERERGKEVILNSTLVSERNELKEKLSRAQEKFKTADNLLIEINQWLQYLNEEKIQNAIRAGVETYMKCREAISAIEKELEEG